MDRPDHEHEQLREQRRHAQARYRQRHAERLAAARQVTNILLRQQERRGDVERLAAALRKRLIPEGIADLRCELGKRSVKRARK